ncbi:PD-(D/E)XK nuclease family protein [Paenibacillus alginolyticus]|uniref:PD-(D/E)XK nuclease family protein n=1 Tax=Paenibacillus alginolyticus TaxID=59839 RepID=UPI00040251BE|nr:PD-(D/E)XK nuclease family protein [Paenibacillus alginolyticus]MCY9666471.1 PD-(D/E)XK nuclease family protein [Paenibacillus alginolyticus]
MTRIQQLYEIMNKNPLKRKVLLVPSLAQGHQWLEQISRVYGAVLNTEVRTLESWSLERLKLQLAKRKLRYLPHSESKWILHRLLQEESKSPSSYLTGITLTPGFNHAFHRALLELRGAGVIATQLLIEDFENEKKGLFVKKLLGRYEEELHRNKLVDSAGLSAFAAQVQLTNEIIIVDPFVIRTEMDEKLLRALTCGKYVNLTAGFEFTDPRSSFPVHNSDFFHALGHTAEVREVIRRIMGSSIALDHVEIIASDYEKYACAIYTVTSSLGVKFTFSEGLPIGITNAGKAVKLYLDWLESGYNLAPILSALKQGIIRFKDERYEGVTTSSQVRELERAGIGWGRERYKLLEHLAALKEVTKERSHALLTLDRVFQRLFAPLTEAALCSPEKLIHAVVEFLENYCVLEEENDYQVLNGLQALEQSLNAAGELSMSASLAIQYLRSELVQMRIQCTSTPSPGHLHVASLNTGGQTGRPYTSIVGMGESNWAFSVQQDPVLLDDERVRISPSLPVSPDRAARMIEERNSRLGMIQGQCVLSYCSYDIADQKENMPAFEMLQIFRRKSVQDDADYEAMHQDMKEVVGYFTVPSDLSMDAIDLWMPKLLSSDSRIYDGQEAVYAYYSHLKDGKLAVEARVGSECTPYDGFVHKGEQPDQLPGKIDSIVFSASKLEQYARCPLQFFYKEILGVHIKDAAVYNRTQWLDAMQRGSLVHEIYNRYLMEVKSRRTHSTDPITHDQSLLHAITEEVIQLYADQMPAPSSHIFQKEAASIRKDVEIFYANEKHRTSIPVFMELQLHGEELPMQLELSDELTVPIRGYVDRVDEIAPHRYKIFDYKTGNPRKYKQNECFSGGTQLQLPLYGAAVEQWMKESGFDSEAQVVDSAYYFPTERGMGEEVSRSQTRRSDLASLLQAMLSSIKLGVFPPTNEPKICNWCDYRAVCGAHAEHFEEKRTAPENVHRLGHILEVNRYA